MKRGVKTMMTATALLLLAGSQTVLAVSTRDKASATVTHESVQSPQTKAPAALNVAAGEARVSINSASAEELMQAMNGVGLKKAQAIVSYREEFGPFKAVDDLKQVPGMGHSLVERNLAHLML